MILLNVVLICLTIFLVLLYMSQAGNKIEDNYPSIAERTLLEVIIFILLFAKLIYQAVTHTGEWGYTIFFIACVGFLLACKITKKKSVPDDSETEKTENTENKEKSKEEQKAVKDILDGIDDD